MDRRTTIASRAGLLAAALLALSCTEAVGPDRSGPGLPSFATTAGSGITLDQLNGTLNESGNFFIKGFNNTNPHHGDAIVATFFWVGSTNTNIIDSVTDVLTMAGYPRVGNHYTLVEFVTAGGISMATYVATNVQGFPDGYNAPAQDSILAVRADLSQSVTDGGLLISAWTGVEGVSTQALGAHSSASGSGSTATLADPGAIAVNAGALALGVTMSNGMVGAEAPPAPWTTLAVQSDANIVDETNDFVASSAGTADPQWTWDFTHQSTWVASVFALNPVAGSTNQPPVAAFSSSCSALTCGFTSTSSDPDGSIASYSWAFGDGTTSTAQNPSNTYAAAGTYTVTLTVTDNQGATNAVSHSVTVTAPNQPPVAAFTKTCSGLTCGFTSTSSDPDGSITAYSWTFGDGATSTAQNPSHTYAAAGTYTVTLTVTDNQGATSSTSQTVTVTQPNSPPVVNAGPDQTAVTGLLYSFSWSFSDANNNGPWSYTIDWGDGSRSTGSVSSQGTYSAGHTYVILLPRNFTIRVTVTDAAGASGSDTKVVSVLLL